MSIPKIREEITVSCSYPGPCRRISFLRDTVNAVLPELICRPGVGLGQAVTDAYAIADIAWEQLCSRYPEDDDEVPL
jgi:hypothetical protein